MRNIKKYRGALGLNQQELADKIKISRVRLISLESDECHSTSPKTLQSLCDFFKVSKVELLGLDNLRQLPESKEDCVYLISLLEEMKKKWD